MKRHRIFLSLAVFAAGFTLGHLEKPEKAFASPQKRCDFTFISDSGEPNIGEAGDIKYDASWKKIVEGGWSLKTATPNGMFVFERCSL